MKFDYRLNLIRLTYAAVCLALCMVLPFLTGQIPEIGSMLLPMHLPVLLCGFLCGWQYGLVVGFVAPLLRFALFGMPPIMPVGIAMAFELATYGAIAGLLYKYLPKKIPYLYVSLISAMLAGRVVWGIVRFSISSIKQTSFTFAAFLSGAFTTAFPGIILQIVLIPIIILALDRAHLVFNNKAKKETQPEVE